MTLDDLERPLRAISHIHSTIYMISRPTAWKHSNMDMDWLRQKCSPRML